MNDKLFDLRGLSGERKQHTELIPSKAVREYMEQQGRILTDFEKATLIYNHSGMDYAEKRERLKELLESTDNEELKEQIQERLEYDERCCKRFYENSEEEIYKLVVFLSEDKDYLNAGYFASGEWAVRCGIDFHEEFFYVEKIKMLMEDLDLEEVQLFPPSIATRYFKGDGRLEDYNSSEEPWTYGDELDKNRFENAYIEIPFPFQDGDFATIKNHRFLKDKICVVERSRDIREYKHSKWGDYSDATMNAAYIYGNAEFGGASANLVDVDYAEVNGDEPEYKLLACAQLLLQGYAGLGDFQVACEGYCRKKKGVLRSC